MKGQLFFEKIKSHYFVDYWIYLLLLFCFFIDWLTGINKIYGGPSPAVPYKFILMFLMTLSIGMKSQQRLDSQFKFIIIIYFYTIIFFCLLVYFFNSYSSLYESLSMLLRIIYAPLVYIYFRINRSKNNFSLFQIEKIVKINFFCICLNEVFGLLGYGVDTYNDSKYGIKGFIFDGNALAAEVYCIYVYFYLKCDKKKGRYILLFLFLGILIGTKVSILSIILYTIISSICMNKKFFLKYTVIFPFFVIIILYIGYINHFFDAFIERINIFYDFFGGNVISVVLSGRNIFLLDHFGFYRDNFSIKQFFFGYGNLSGGHIIEIDPFDTLFSYGVSIFLPILLYYFYVCYKNRRNKGLLVFNLLYLLISFTSGHVWFNTSSALFFAIVNIYCCGNNEKNILYK
jgi:hypothetical protein